jgi:hypothetical protein
MVAGRKDEMRYAGVTYIWDGSEGWVWWQSLREKSARINGVRL